MEKQIIIKCLRERTFHLFGDNWYEETATLLYNDLYKKKGSGYVYFIKFSNSNLLKLESRLMLLVGLNQYKLLQAIKL
jgi:hypothetical protein